jgi:hypothetical protein
MTTARRFRPGVLQERNPIETGKQTRLVFTRSLSNCHVTRAFPETQAQRTKRRKTFCVPSTQTRLVFSSLEGPGKTLRPTTFSAMPAMSKLLFMSMYEANREDSRQLCRPRAIRKPALMQSKIQPRAKLWNQASCSATCPAPLL